MRGHENRAAWNLCLWAYNEEPIYRDLVANRPYNARKAREWAGDTYGAETPDGDKLADIQDWQAIADTFNEYE